MKWATFILVSILLATSFLACTQRMICPAFQSAYIYDEDYLREKFSYFKNDSTPKILTASKNRYLIAVPKSYRRRMKALQTIEMKEIYPVVSDTLQTGKDSDKDFDELIDQELASSSDNDLDSLSAESTLLASDTLAGVQTKALDSITTADSTYVITLAKEKYNVDQDMYMWYLRDILVLPDVRALNSKKEKTEKNQKKRGRKNEEDSLSTDSLQIGEMTPKERKRIKRERKKKRLSDDSQEETDNLEEKTGDLEKELVAPEEVGKKKKHSIDDSEQIGENEPQEESSSSE